MRAIAIGECMVELRPAGEGLFARGFAGDAYNTAVYLKRSAPALEVDFLTVTGVGGFSAAMRQAWSGEGIDDRLAFAVEGAEPGLYMIELDARGDRSFRYWRSASPARGWLDRLEGHGGADVLAGADLVYLSGISLAILPAHQRGEAVALMASLKGRVGKIAFDPNVRLSLWADADDARAALAPMIAACDILKASRDDAHILTGEPDAPAQVAALQRMGAGEIALTLDADGCLIAHDGTSVALPAAPAQVLDTAGAGDAFNGAYLAARLAGVSPVDAAKAGLAVAARVVAAPGAVVAKAVSHP